MEARRYTFKLYPNATQDRALHNQRRLCGDVWNACIQQREESYRRAGKSLSYFDQSKEVKDIRRECPEFMAVSASSLALVTKSVDLAYQAFFRRLKEGKTYAEAGHPRFRHPNSHPSIPHRDGAWRMAKTDGKWRVSFFGVDGAIKARGRFPIDPTEKEQFRSCEVLWRDGSWWLSAVVKIPARRSAGAGAATVRFNLIDEFARVERKNGAMSVPRGSAQAVSAVPDHEKSGQYQRHVSTSGVDAGEIAGGDRIFFRLRSVFVGVDAGELRQAVALERRADVLKAERDARFKRGSRRWKEWTRRARLKTAKAARIRKEALHRWTTALVSSVDDLTVVKPPVREVTKSAKGTEKDHGAAVETVAMVNRHILRQAPALAVQMIEYKAAEAGVRCDVLSDPEPKAATAQHVSLATKEARKAKKAVRRAAKKTADAPPRHGVDGENRKAA